MADELIAGVDYYVEAGRWVFTAHYLRKRGDCCRSGCRHCPYGFTPPAREEKTEKGEADDGYSMR